MRLCKCNNTVISVILFTTIILSGCEGLTPGIKDSEEDTESVANSENSDDTVEDTASENSSDHDSDSDYTWNNSDIISIQLNGSSITAGNGVNVSGSKATITSAGIYSISGDLNNGQIIVDTDDEEIVRLILNDASIVCSSGPSIFIDNSEKTMIVLADNTNNSLSDGSSYSDEELNAALFSKSNLTIYGDGSLTVLGNYNDGITSKDGLIITSGNITVDAVDDGIRGKDYLIIKNANLNIETGGDGLKSDNENDSLLGYISIETGNFEINAAGDAITAQTDVLISSGEFNLKSGGGSGYSASSTYSYKGIKAAVNITIDDGNFTINSADDAIHSNDYLIINKGTFEISSGDDGIHADNILGINGGTINITKSYEGIESAEISITDGTIFIVSSDDGLNVAGGMDNSGGWPGGKSAGASSYYLYLTGGYININASGDGIDVNGSIEMSAGTVIVNGPTSNGNGALDYDSSFKISGGFLLAAGSSGMLQAPGSSSSQYTVATIFSSNINTGQLIHLQTSDGEKIFTFKTIKKVQAVVFSSPDLQKDSSYEIYFGGSSTGTENNGLFEDGIYSPGTKFSTFSISSLVTVVR